MIENGYVKLFRKFEKWEWYDDANTMRLFIHCLLKTNHTDRKYQGTLVEKGSFLTSYKDLSKELKLSIQKIRTSIEKLKSTNELTVKSTSKGTQIYIVKWEDYQVSSVSDNIDNNTQNNKPITNEQQTDNKRITTNKNVKNVKNKELKDIYGEFRNVFLTKNELEKLKGKLDHKIYIERLSAYMASSGKKYKSHYATILNWHRKDEVNNNGESTNEPTLSKRFGIDLSDS